MIIAVSVCPTVIHKPLHWNICAGASPLSMFTNVPFWPPIFAHSWPYCRPLKYSFREFKVVFIKILTNEPWILSVYRQIVTVYFSVCKTGYVSIYLTNNFYTSTVFNESTNFDLLPHFLQPVNILQKIRLFRPVLELSTRYKKQRYITWTI